MDKEAIIVGITADELKAINPALAEALRAEGRAVGMADAVELSEKTVGDTARAEGYAKGLEEGKVAGAEAERNRIKDVEAQALPGHAELIEQLKWDGKTTGPEAAVKILQHEKEARTIHKDKLKADALKPLAQPSVQVNNNTGNPDGETGDAKKKEREHAIAAYQAEHKVDYRAAALAVSRQQPELFKDR